MTSAGLLDAAQWQEAALDDLEQFRAMWWKNFRWGFKDDSDIRFPASLRPMDFKTAEFARKDAFEEYYRPSGHADLNVGKKLYRDTIAAIDEAAGQRARMIPPAQRAQRLDKLWRRQVTQQLIDRDGAICWLCGKACEANGRTIEHLVELAQGGTNSLDNLALAHFVCNVRMNGLTLRQKRELRAELRKLLP